MFIELNAHINKTIAQLKPGENGNLINFPGEPFPVKLKEMESITCNANHS